LSDPASSQPRRFGWPIEFSANSTHAPNTLVAVPLDLPAGTVVGFGLIAKAAGPQSCMVLYADRAGAPAALVTFTRPFALALGAQSLEAAAPIEIAQGRFWLATLFDRQASLGIDYADKGAISKWVSHAFGSPPDIFPAPHQFAGQRYNLWVSLQ